MKRLYSYARIEDGEMVEIFETQKQGLPVYLVREGRAQDSVAHDRESVEDYRSLLSDRGFIQVAAGN